VRDSKAQGQGLRLEVSKCIILEGQKPSDYTVQELKVEA